MRGPFRTFLPGFWIVVAGAAVMPAQAEQPATLEKTESLLESVTPTFAAPYPELSPGWEPVPLRLVGVDLAQEGESAPAPRPVLDSSRPLTITCYWLAERKTSRKQDLELRIASHDDKISRVEEVKAGPDDAAWNAGSLYKQRFVFPLSPIASTITGDAMLSLSLFPRQQGSTLPVTLQRVPLHLEPLLRAGRISERSLNSAIPGDYHDLSVSFRLGRNARQTVRLPEQKAEPATAVAVVSSVAYGSPPQGETVCEIIARNQGGETHAWSLISGLNTARSDYDFYPPGSVNHEKTTIVESWDAGYPDVFNKPFKKHKYLAVLPLPPAARTADSLEFVSKTPFVIDIYDVALIRD